ncbi:MAG: hypothetical protein GXP49_14050 [Deltaproteobacteria bacterium]|nr:hypothetical protein [Deltaproteobacteria bacterium]
MQGIRIFFLSKTGLAALFLCVFAVFTSVAFAIDELPEDMSLASKAQLLSLKKKFEKKKAVHKAKLPALKKQLSRSRQLLPQELWPIQRKLQAEIAAINKYEKKIEVIDEELSRRQMETGELQEAKDEARAKYHEMIMKRQEEQERLKEERIAAEKSYKDKLKILDAELERKQEEKKERTKEKRRKTRIMYGIVAAGIAIAAGAFLFFLRRRYYRP